MEQHHISFDRKHRLSEAAVEPVLSSRLIDTLGQKLNHRQLHFIVMLLDNIVFLDSCPVEAEC